MKNRYQKLYTRNFNYDMKKLLLILLGATIQGFAMGEFLFPNAIPSGGAGGLTVLFNYLLHIPTGLALWIINASMLLFAVHFLGTANVIGTLIGFSITSISVDFFETKMYMPFHNVWIELIIGSVLLGTGIAILLREGVSNGGVGVIALIISQKKGIDPGKTLFWINGAIFILTAYIIDWKIIIEAVCCQWLSTQVVDRLYHANLPWLTSNYHPSWRKK